MKICLVSNYRDNGYGESTRPYHLSIELLKQGHQILHICDTAGGTRNGIRYVSKNISTVSSLRLRRFLNFFRLFFKIKLFSPDLIYVHQFNNGQWAIATRMLPDVPLVFDAHTSLYFECEVDKRQTEVLEHIFKVEKEICSDVDFIVAASEETQEILRKLYELPVEKMFVVKNATSFSPILQPLQLMDEDFICSATLPQDGFVSNTLALEFLFEVAKSVYLKDPRIKFQVIGGGGKPYPPVSNVVYTGYVEDLRDVLLLSHVCLSPYPENAVCGGARNKVCDYLAMGKAIVSTKEGMRGFSDLIKGEHYFEANSVEEFAEAIFRMRSDISLRRKIELNALEASREYQWKNRAKELNNVFKRILTSNTAH